jgi:hypothetical protein
MRRAASLVIVVLVTVMASDLTGSRRTEGSHSPSGLPHALAQTGGGASTILSTGYDLTWYTIDNGGGSNGDTGHTLDGTIGQPDAGAWNAGAWSGGEYTLVGGFWSSLGSAPIPRQYRIYLPVVLRRA